MEAIHALQIAQFGGLAGTRDPGSLASALARPLHLAAYGKPSIHELAAAYAFGIARNHPFVDGNKRTALVASFVFLEINGFDVTAPEEDAAIAFVELAAGRMGEKALVRWLEGRTAPRKRK